LTYTLSLHDALPISREAVRAAILKSPGSIVPEHDPFLRD